MTRHHDSWRRRLYRNLDPAAWHKPGVSPLNRAIMVVIVLAVATAVAQTEPTIRAGRDSLFRGLEIVFAVVFLAEYMARLWIAAENPKFGPGWRGMARYAKSLPALIDLVAVLTLFMTVFGSEGAFLRLIRLVRIIMLAKFGRYSTALNAIWGAVHSRRYELLTSLGIAGMLVLVSSTLLFLVEGDIQPEGFGSIPRAMWWSVATLTTVGYGDVYPVTALGRILAGMTAISGIGLIAMPTGILAAAFSDAMQRQREQKERQLAARAAHRHAGQAADQPETASMDYAGEKDWALDKALALLDTHPLVDAHNDLPYLIRYGTARGDIRAYGLDRLKPGAETDIPRMREGRMAAQVWAAFIPASSADPARATLAQIELIRQLSDIYPETFRHAVAASDIEAAKREGRIASIVGVEGGLGMKNDLAMLRTWHGLGARVMTLCHNETLDWVDSATDAPRHGGLSGFGRDVVRELNRLGMIVDCSHVHPAAVHQVLDVSSAPIALTHSNSFALCDHPRNAPDDILARIPQNGGIVMATFVPPFLSQANWDWSRPLSNRFGSASSEFSDKEQEQAAQARREHLRNRGPAPEATIEHLIEHIEYLTAKCGIDHVGISSDFYGGSTPRGLHDVSCYPHVLAALIRRGWSDDAIGKIAGGNFIRVFGAVEEIGRRLNAASA